MSTKHVGLIGKVGPLFRETNARDGMIEIADNNNDATWAMPIPGTYFGYDQHERVSAAFRHLIANEDN